MCRLEDPVYITQELIRLGDPQECLDFVRYSLESMGFTCEVLTFNGISNLFAKKITPQVKAKNSLLFLGHVDVVPAGDPALWCIPPFSGANVEGKIYGRGSVDMKGGIACFLSALWRVKDAEQSLYVLITCDEEGPAEYGTKAALQYLLDKGMLGSVAFAIVGEPTSIKIAGDHIKIGGRGSLNAAVTVTGVAGHVAYSANAINPIPRAVGFMRELCEATFDNSSDEIFERTNIELTSIDVNNIATNVIPESIRIQFNIRFNCQHTHVTLVSFIENIAKKYSDVQWHFSYNFASIPFLSAPSEHLDYLVKICEGVNGAAPFVSTHGASSDARFLQNICPFVEVGLLAEQAHKINEHTTVADLLALHSIFYEVLRGFNAGRAFDTFV